MNILAIETSCDETAISILKCREEIKNDLKTEEHRTRFKILGNTLLSQIAIHKDYGGVFPSLAKREHSKNLVPLLEASLEEAELLHEDVQAISADTRNKISEILSREPGLSEAFSEFIYKCETPDIDAIAVTVGPGLEPALWVGINFAKALSVVWEKPLVAVNHMEGHIMAALAQTFQGSTLEIKDIAMPVLALLISGGHTELVLMKEWLKYERLGGTRDDAVGEAFDKVARMLGLPYPGGPEISRLAELVREYEKSDFINSFGSMTSRFVLPRPMIHDATCDFSFSGLKTAVLYLLKKNPEINDAEKQLIACEFENAVAEVLWKKTARALEETHAKTLVIGGGVSANTHIRNVFKSNLESLASTKHLQVELRMPPGDLSTDNAIMIALAGFYRAQRCEFVTDPIANGNQSLA